MKDERDERNKEVYNERQRQASQLMKQLITDQPILPDDLPPRQTRPLERGSYSKDVVMARPGSSPVRTQPPTKRALSRSPARVPHSQNRPDGQTQHLNKPGFGSTRPIKTAQFTDNDCQISQRPTERFRPEIDRNQATVRLYGMCSHVLSAIEIKPLSVYKVCVDNVLSATKLLSVCMVFVDNVLSAIH